MCLFTADTFIDLSDFCSESICEFYSLICGTEWNVMLRNDGRWKAKTTSIINEEHLKYSEGGKKSKCDLFTAILFLVVLFMCFLKIC